MAPAERGIRISLNRFTRREFLAVTAAAGAVARAAGKSADELARDPQRPQYHFLPPRNWMNDPNGPILWKGRWHMYYQHNPNGAFWGDMHWGHAVSEDMVHWRHRPMALAPDQDYDEDGVFSGSAVVLGGRPVIYYTGVRPEVQCIAEPLDDSLDRWKKHAANPVISEPPLGEQSTGFRDPCLWRKDGVWYMLVGSGVKDTGGVALLYRSKDGFQWEYVHVFCSGKMDPARKDQGVVRSGEMWECPDFFPLGDRHVLIISTLGTTIWHTGEYRDDRFHPEREGELDFGCSYAPKITANMGDRRILWAWIREQRTKEAHSAAGWACCMSLPRELSLGPGGIVETAPAKEVEALRGSPSRVGGRSIAPGKAALIEDVSGDCLEVLAEIEPGDSREAGLVVRASADLSERTEIVYQRGEKQLVVDRSASGTAEGADREVTIADLELRESEPLELRVFVDASVIEIYANSRCVVTNRVYPGPDSLGIGLVARGGSARLRQMTTWPIKPISADRLTT